MKIGKCSKYRNIKTVVDGITFDSKKEAKRYQDLKLLEKRGWIIDLTIKPKYELLIVQNEAPSFKVGAYVADFLYRKRKIKDGQFTNCVDIVVEDVKSEITRKNPVYRIKKKLMKAIYGIDIVEV